MEHKFYTEIHEEIDDTPMSVCAYRLYFHLKRIATERGACEEDTNKLAKACNMSAGSVSNAKGELRSLGLIKETKVGKKTSITVFDRPQGGRS